MSLAVIQADCNKAIASLERYTNEELDALINNDEKIENILSAMDKDFLKDIENEKETLLASNTSLSEFNLNREPQLIDGRQRIAELSTQGEQLSSTVEEKIKELKEKSGDVSLETTLALLQTAASEMEEESDKVAQQFLGTEVELDEFLDNFLSKRKTMHLRLVKAEKMAKILSRDPSINNIPSYVNAPPVSINTNYFPNTNPVPNVPYPVGPIGMPMPGLPNYFQNHY